MTETKNRNQEELENPQFLGIYEETAELKKVLMWGTPGSEAVLGQLLPKRISCFESGFDVLAARKEFDNAAQILQDNGVEVVFVKDLFAKMIQETGIKPSLTLDDLKEELEERGNAFYKRYGDSSTAELDILSWIGPILEQDATQYGEATAVAINRVLSLGRDLPLANILYARDQSNLLGNTWAWSSMKYPIRQPEVELYKKILNHGEGVLSENIHVVEVDEKGRFEGGDGIANNGIFYIGVGGRTNLDGVMQVAKSILNQSGRVMIPIDEGRDMGRDTEMDAMHLDTIWMPSSQNEIIACMGEVERRKLLEVVADGSGRLTLQNKGWFADHLEERAIDLIPLTKDEQESYAPNLLNLGLNRIVLSMSKGHNLTEELTRRGKLVYNANLDNITKGYGGLHCLTASIRRG